MSAACPKGHTSEARDYCSVCGTPMTTAAPAAEVTVERCPNCGSPPQSATACLECGYLLGAADVVAPWEEQNWEILVRPGPGVLREPGARRDGLPGADLPRAGSC